MQLLVNKPTVTSYFLLEQSRLIGLRGWLNSTVRSKLHRLQTAAQIIPLRICIFHNKWMHYTCSPSIIHTFTVFTNSLFWATPDMRCIIIS
eukprot:13200_6